MLLTLPHISALYFSLSLCHSALTYKPYHQLSQTIWSTLIMPTRSLKMVLDFMQH